MHRNRRGFRLITGIGIPLVAILALIGLLGQHMIATRAANGQGNRSNR